MELRVHVSQDVGPRNVNGLPRIHARIAGICGIIATSLTTAFDIPQQEL
jgi:hypothetical protein